MIFGERILDYWDDILRDLGRLVAIPSVAQPQDGAHPFGDECAKALDLVLEMAEDYGLKTKNVGYYAGHAEYGEGDENAVVMAHVDVVPAGILTGGRFEGWNTDPFTLVVDGNRAFGRGVADDKGAAVVALHCLRALKDAGVKGKRKLRVIFGSGEEIGMGDMAHYFASEQHPDMGFTPDSCYGICHCEKGIIDFKVTAKNDSAVIKSFTAGTVANAVPAKAECEVKCSAEEREKLIAAANSSEVEITVTPTRDGAVLLSKGQAAHASTPWAGKNAASHLVKLLTEVFGEKTGSFFRFIDEKIGLTHDGSLLGVNMSDEPSGPLTFNLGLVHVDEDSCDLTVDIRYPATKNGKEITDKIADGTKPYGVEFTVLSDAAPLYLPKESELITLLSGAYKDVTGEECSIFSMGGGTYARQMFGKGVAFGPGFADQEDAHEHDVNEQIELDRFKLHAKICLESMYRMLTAE